MRDYTDIRILLDIELFDRSYHYSDRDGVAHSYSTSADGRVVVESDMVMYKGLIKNPASIKEGLDPTKGSPAIGNVKVTLINEDNLQDGNTTVALESATATLLLVRGDMYDEVVDSMIGKIDGVGWDNSTLSFTIKSSEIAVFRQVPEIILNENTFQSRVVLFDPVIEQSDTVILRFAKAGNTQVIANVIRRIYHPALASPSELGDGFPYVEDYWVGARLDIVDAEGAFGDPESEVFCIGEFGIVVDSDEDWVQLPTTVDRYYLYTFIDDNLRKTPLVVPTSNIPYEVRDIINNTTQNAVKMAEVSVQNGDFSASAGWTYATPPWDINVTTPNKAHRSNSAGTALSKLKQQISIAENVDYTVTVTVSNLSGGSIIMYLGSSSVELASDGIHQITMTAVNTINIPYVGFYATADTVVADLDDLTVTGSNSSTMQLIRRAIPENADSVGKPFPIVYGEVSKMWAVWSISNKSTRQNSLSAGDDVYVIAGHRIYDNDPTEVLVYYGLDEKVAEWMNVKPGVIDFVPNPLPRSINEIERWHEAGFDLRSGDSSKDVSPLHSLVEITTNEGDTVTAIRLRGAEYTGFIPDPVSGADGDSPIVNGQPQFPIRYGLGNSKVFVSFRGYADENGYYTGVEGGLIDHPIDIIKHFMLNHTNIEGNTAQIDEEAFAVAKAKLENWRFGAVINELVDGEKVLERLCSQCKASWQWHNDVFSIKVLDLESRQPTRFIDQEKHFTGNQSWSRTPLTSVYNDFTFRYAYNAITQNFDRVITKNKGNNQRCRDSFALYGAIRSFNAVEFTDIYDSYTANQMAEHYVALYAPPRITFKTGLRLADETQGLAPGEVVSIAFRTDLGALNEVVYLTTSVTASPTGLQASFLELVA